MQLNLTKPLVIAPFFLWGTAMVAMKSTLDNTTPLFMAGVRLLRQQLSTVFLNRKPSRHGSGLACVLWLMERCFKACLLKA